MNCSGTELGWLAPQAPWPLVARGADGAEAARTSSLPATVRGWSPRRSIVPIMMTTNPEIAHSDCLFYAVEPQRPDGGLGLKPQ